MNEISASPLLTRPGGSERGAGAASEMAVGFVGLGRMRTAMAANLATAGCRVVAYVRRPEQPVVRDAALRSRPATS